MTVHGEERATLGPGDYFGEIALIDEGARTATVTAETDMTTYAMTFWEFRPIVETDARIAWKLVQELAHRLREADAADLAPVRQVSSERERSSRAREGSPDSATVSAPGTSSSTIPAEDDAVRCAGAPHDLAGRLAERRRRVDAALAGDDEVNAERSNPTARARTARRGRVRAERRKRRAEPARSAGERRSR